MKNHVASVRARLQNHAREHRLELGAVLEKFALGQLLIRLSRSRYSDRFVLKGAQLFTIWSESPHRPTRDVDFLSFGEVNEQILVTIFVEISSQVVEDDGLSWSEITATPIREANLYGGIRVRLTALLGNARIPVQVDIGYGDVITPAPMLVQVPVLLGYAAPELLAYPPESVIAEKLEAAVALGIANSRMKDFYDLHWLSQNMQFDHDVLRAAVRATFDRRRTSLPTELPVAFTAEFSSRPDKLTQWNAFLRKSGLAAMELSMVIGELRAFLIDLFADWRT
jgi:predicted nucleotidyltransferase component of viral defense system